MTETITIEHLVVAYRSCFTAPGSDLALRDLAEFCRASVSCVVPGDRDQTLINEGRREAFLRIQNFLNLTPEQLVAIRVGQTPRNVNVRMRQGYNG